MFRFYFLFMLSVAFLSVCWAQNPNNPINQPSPSMNAPVDSLHIWDFGQVKQGEIVAHDFILSNDTGKTLYIKNTNTSCGCTVSAVDKKVLLPKESTKINAKFNSKGYNGPVQQFIYVNTDNIDNPVIRFIIKADVTK